LHDALPISVNAWQYTYLNLDRAHSFIVTTVDARLTGNDARTNDVRFNATKHIFNIVCRYTGFFINQLSHSLIAQLSQTVITLGFVSDAVGNTDRVGKMFFYRSLEVSINDWRLPIPARLTCITSQFGTSLNNNLHLLVRIQHSAEHDVFRQLFRFGLHHQYGVFSTGNHHVQLRGFKLFVGR